MGVDLQDTAVHYLESLVKQRNFAGAIEYYQANKDELNGADGQASAAVLRLVARAHASLSHFSTALKCARTAQAIAAKEGETLLLAEIFMAIAEILRDMGEMKEAERAFRDAESIFRRKDCLEGQSRALNLLAGLFFHQSDYNNSLNILMDAVEIARQLGDRKKLAFMMGNIGRIHTFVGDFAEAERHLRMNIELSRELGDELETSRALLSLGYVYIQKGQYDKAETALADAYPGIINQKSSYDEGIYLTYLGELQYRTGRLDDATTTLNKAVDTATRLNPDSALTGRALRHLAEVYLRAGNLRLAQKTASKAMSVLEKADEPIEIGAVLKIKAQIATLSGKTEEARSLFQKSIDTLDRTGVRFEKMDAMIAASTCDAFSHRRRLTFLFRAEEFYSRCRAAVKREEVGKRIAALESAEETPRQLDRAEAGSTDYLTNSPEIKQIKSQLKLLAKADLPLLLTGETGVGKDHMARYFHSLARPDGPYVAINCASVPETLLESELFGYHKGAFTGADGNKLGLFVKANGGTLFLDEIGDMPLSLQAKLLGVLESRKIIPLGSTTEVSLDFKLVAASNRDLETMVEQGLFRRDLYYRLSGIAFKIPALRERKEDIPLLLNRFLADFNLTANGASLPSELVRKFVEYDWPGNVRELQNKVKRLEVMAGMVADGDIGALAESLFGVDDTPMPENSSFFDKVEEFERRLIFEAVLAAGGNKCEAARMLGIHEATVRTKLKRYGISLDEPWAEARVS
jgi:transcriptional regulator with PAS, ATPase and Fis domain